MVHLDDGTPAVAVTCNDEITRNGSLLTTAMAAVQVGAQNVRLNADLLARMAELRDSRARIVEAGLSQRRQVERDLHDGAQQRFLAVAATLARSELVPDAEVREVVDAARAGLAAALRELRELARGIHPAALSQGGLPAALPALSSGTPGVQLTVDPDLSWRRPAAAQEAAAYFLVAEALANVGRHTTSSHVSVIVCRAEDRLCVVISDDGPGTARLVPGGGLAGLADRVEALGGEFTVHNDPCPLHSNISGTTLSALLPEPESEG
jgi:signal transduction histidine kinase